MSAERVIEIARGELGYREYPAGSNRTKYGQAFAWDGVPWSAVFLWWCFRQAGEGGAFYGGKKTASCGTLLRWYQARGQTVPPEDARPGDILILRATDPWESRRCGLVEQVVERERGWYRTLEGDAASDSDSGCVALKLRNRNSVVGVCRPRYGAEPEGR